MVEEIVGTILEAEDKAEEIKKQAKEQAKKSVEEALASSSANREVILKRYKVDINQAKSAAAASSEALYNQILNDGGFQIAAASETADKNMDRAVKEIVRSIIG